MKVSKKIFIGMTASILLLAAGSGCALEDSFRNTAYAPDSAFPNNGVYSGGQHSSVTSVEGYQCSNDSKVKPDYDWFLDRRGFFKVCRNPNAPSRILFLGHTAERRICIFPALESSADQIDVYPNNSNGLVHTCVERRVHEESGTPYFIAEFPDDISFNAVFIAEYSAASRLQMCLGGDPLAVEGPNYYFCPGVTDNESYFSYGRVTGN